MSIDSQVSVKSLKVILMLELIARYWDFSIPKTEQANNHQQLTCAVRLRQRLDKSGFRAFL